MLLVRMLRLSPTVTLQSGLGVLVSLWVGGVGGRLSIIGGVPGDASLLL